MTEADRARIAREWGIPLDEIPQPTICPPNTWAENVDTWRNLRNMHFRMMVRRNKFAALAAREGRNA